MASRFEVFEDKAGQHRFRLKTDGGVIVASAPEPYETAAAVRAGVASVREAAAGAQIVEV